MVCSCWNRDRWCAHVGIETGGIHVGIEADGMEWRQVVWNRGRY